MLRFEEALERHRKRRLTADEAGELLGNVGRHFRRLIVRYDEEGAEGLHVRRHFSGAANPAAASFSLSAIRRLRGVGFFYTRLAGGLCYPTVKELRQLKELSSIRRESGDPALRRAAMAGARPLRSEAG